MTERNGGNLLRLWTLLCAVIAATQVQAAPCLRGINLAGAEFGTVPGEYGKNYIYPSDRTLLHFAQKGMNVIRLPFKWERLQPKLNGPLDEDELDRIKATVDSASSRGLTTILDPHNYAGYNQTKLGEGDVTAMAFGDFWARLAPHFSGREDVVYLLMNEPAGITAATWLEAINAALAAIRKAGAGNLVMVPGTIWTGASHWFDRQPGGSNADVLQNVRDPRNRFVFDIHQYMDDDFSGTHRTCPRVEDAIKALEGVSGWLHQHGYAGFLGEFGGTNAPDCLNGLAAIASYINSQSDTWIGWSVWAAGPWWGEYPLSLQPEEGVDRPQMKVLEPHVRDAGLEMPACPARR